jgi:hypothetical protein
MTNRERVVVETVRGLCSYTNIYFAQQDNSQDMSTVGSRSGRGLTRIRKIRKCGYHFNTKIQLSKYSDYDMGLLYRGIWVRFQEKHRFLSYTASRPALHPTEPLIQCVQGFLLRGQAARA